MRNPLGRTLLAAGVWAALSLPGIANTGAAPTEAPAQAPAEAPACVGRDILESLPAAQRAAIDQAVAATPYAKGTRWVATKGKARIEIIGTYHFGDPRHLPRVNALTPIIESASVLLVEAGPDEEARLTGALAQHPELMVDSDGPTLPERMDKAEWDQLAAAMAQRGMPAIMVSKMRPWYISMMLGISPCMLGQIKAAGDTGGLDHLLIDTATDSGTPIHALEPWDTVFSLFSGMTPEEELDMIRAAMPAAKLADDYAKTTIEAYFRGDIWAIWEFGRQDAYTSTRLDRAAVDRQIELAEDRLMAERNERWIPVLTREAETAAAQGRPVVAAFGALHLPGERGVLRLLEKDGWTITKGAGP